MTRLDTRELRAATRQVPPEHWDVERGQPGSMDLVTGMATTPVLAMKIVLVETTSMPPSTLYLASGRGRRKRGLGAFEPTIGLEANPYRNRHNARAPTLALGVFARAAREPGPDGGLLPLDIVREVSRRLVPERQRNTASW